MGGGGRGQICDKVEGEPREATRGCRAEEKGGGYCGEQPFLPCVSVLRSHDDLRARGQTRNAIGGETAKGFGCVWCALCGVMCRACVACAWRARRARACACVRMHAQALIRACVCGVSLTWRAR